MFPITSVTLVISHLHQLLLRSNNEVTAILVAETFYSTQKRVERSLGASLSTLPPTLRNFSQIQPCSVCFITKQAGGLSWILEIACSFPRAQCSLTKLHLEVSKTKVGILRQLCPKAHWLIRQWQTLVMEAASPISLSRVIWFCCSFELLLFWEEIRYSCWMRCDQNILFLLL